MILGSFRNFYFGQKKFDQFPDIFHMAIKSMPISLRRRKIWAIWAWIWSSYGKCREIGQIFFCQNKLPKALENHFYRFWAKISPVENSMTFQAENSKKGHLRALLNFHSLYGVLQILMYQNVPH